jgi:hypothetical protein
MIASGIAGFSSPVSGRFPRLQAGNPPRTMTSRRAQSYGRVVETLRSTGEPKLHPEEQDQIREAADALLFCEDIDAGSEAKLALDGVRELSRRLAGTGRWSPDAADRLLEDIAGCGPVLLLV